MTQQQALILAFKIVEVASVAAIAAFVACYSKWARWWENAIGRTLVFKDIALVLVLIPSILSIFIDFNRLTSRIAGWFDVTAFALVPVIMVWRTFVFRKIHKTGHESTADAGNLPREDSSNSDPEGP
jgi:hypothetical protein